MIFLGIDDTDMPDTPGTNQLAKRIVRDLAADFRCAAIIRHQLFFDPRVPYTSKNGSASIWLEPLGVPNIPALADAVRHIMQEWYVPGSDPGFALAEHVSPAVTAYAHRCKTELILQSEPRALAEQAGIHLEGLAGTQGGVIGALAAVGLAAEADDGRVVQWRTFPDDLTGLQAVATILAREIDVRCEATQASLATGLVDIGKHLRPNLRGGRAVLFVAAAEHQLSPDISHWIALRRL